jgi:hypothetical protein
LASPRLEPLRGVRAVEGPRTKRDTAAYSSRDGRVSGAPLLRSGCNCRRRALLDRAAVSLRNKQNRDQSHSCGDRTKPESDETKRALIGHCRALVIRPILRQETHRPNAAFPVAATRFSPMQASADEGAPRIAGPRGERGLWAILRKSYSPGYATSCGRIGFADQPEEGHRRALISIQIHRHCLPAHCPEPPHGADGSSSTSRSLVARSWRR